MLFLIYTKTELKSDLRVRLLFFAFQGVIDYVKKEKFRAEGALKISDVEFCRKMRASVGEGLKALQI